MLETGKIKDNINQINDAKTEMLRISINIYNSVGLFHPNKSSCCHNYSTDFTSKDMGRSANIFPYIFVGFTLSTYFLLRN